MPWEKVAKVLEEEWEEPLEELFEDFEHEAAAARLDRPGAPRACCPTGAGWRSRSSTPAWPRRSRADMQNAGMILRMAKALAPGLDAKAAAEELKERVLEELDYEYEAQNQRSFARGYRGHPFIHVPDVVTRLSTDARAGDRVGRRHRLRGGQGSCRRTRRDRFGEIVFRFCFGSIYHLQHFNADAHPGNYILMEDGRSRSSTSA